MRILPELENLIGKEFTVIVKDNVIVSATEVVRSSKNRWFCSRDDLHVSPQDRASILLPKEGGIRLVAYRQTVNVDANFSRQDILEMFLAGKIVELDKPLHLGGKVKRIYRPL